MRGIFATALCSLLLATAATTAHARSEPECDAYARSVADEAGNPGQVLGGAFGGAITGAILGGILGGGKGAGQGAAIGGGVGAVGGAAHASGNWHAAYRYAFDECMSGDLEREAAYDGPPPPRSPEWYDYCAAKYRSFDPDTGRYLSGSGQWKVCR